MRSQSSLFFESSRSLLIGQFMFYIDRNTAFSWHKRCLSFFRVILDHLVFLDFTDHLPRSICHSRQKWEWISGSPFLTLPWTLARRVSSYLILVISSKISSSRNSCL